MSADHDIVITQKRTATLEDIVKVDGSPVLGQAIVIDLKFGELYQAGFAGDDSPKIVEPLPKEKKADLESLFREIFSSLEVDPSEHPVLLTEDCGVSEDEFEQDGAVFRHSLGKMLFETFGVQGFYISIQPILSLYASGKTTGCVFESNEVGLSYIVPIEDGAALTSNITRFQMNGGDLTSYMMKLLNDRGYPFQTQAEHEIVRDCKEKLCYVAPNFEEEMIKAKQSDIEKMYELPDGQLITVGNERFRVPEVLFKPNLIGRELHDNIHELIYSTIMKSQGELRATLFDNIVLSGSNTLFEGIAQRLKTEILAWAPQGMKVNIIAPPERKYSSWIGASIQASLDSFQKQWITKQDYDQAAADGGQEKVKYMIQRRFVDKIIIMS